MLSYLVHCTTNEEHANIRLFYHDSIGVVHNALSIFVVSNFQETPVAEATSERQLKLELQTGKSSLVVPTLVGVCGGAFKPRLFLIAPHGSRVSTNERQLKLTTFAGSRGDQVELPTWHGI